MGLTVITGAAGALGQAIAHRIASTGDRVLLVDVSAHVHDAAGRLAAARIPTDALIADLGSEDGARAVAAEVDRIGLPVATLVNNAGINRDARASAMTDEQFRAVVRTDLLGPCMLCQVLADQMADGGTVVNVSSRAALGNFGQVNYVAAKAGLIGLTRALALKWAPRVRVNAVAPGLVDTPMTAGMPPKVLHRLVERIPAERMAIPDEIADVVSFLASPASAYITGQFLPVCGGRSLV